MTAPTIKNPLNQDIGQKLQNPKKTTTKSKKSSLIAQNLSKTVDELPSIGEKKEFTILFNKFFSLYELFKIEENKNELYYIKKLKHNKLFCLSKSNFKETCWGYFLEIARQQKADLRGLNTHLQIITIEDFKRNSERLMNYFEIKGLIKHILNVQFKPIQEVYIKKDYGVYLNTFEPTKYLIKEKLNKINDFPNIRELMLNLCNNDGSSYERFIKILAHSLQRPEEKWQGYIVLQGDGASGKGTFFELVLKPLFDKYFIAGSKEQLIGKQFNSHSMDKLWIAVEEFKGDSKTTDLASTIKMLTGGNTQFKESKGVDAIEVNDYARYIITTNEFNPKLKLKTHDRRANIFGHSRALGGSQENSAKIRKKYNGKIPGELESFAYYLHHLEFDTAEIFQSFKNERFMELLRLDYSNTGHFTFYLEELLKIDDNKVVYLYDLIDNKTLNLEIMESNAKKYITCQSIYELFKSFCLDENKNIVSVNNFWAEFYQITAINKSCRVGKSRNRCILLEDFLNYFKCEFGEIENKIKTNLTVLFNDVNNQDKIIKLDILNKFDIDKKLNKVLVDLKEEGFLIEPKKGSFCRVNANKRGEQQ